MKVIINDTKNLNRKFLEQISYNSPWEGLKWQLLKDSITDIWVRAVKENISSILLSNNDEIISYWCFWNKWKLFEWIIESTKFELEKTFVWIYLFTVEKYQNQWYAEKLKKEQINYIKEKYPNIKYLLWTTFSKELLDLYKKYWAKEIKNINRNNAILVKEWITKDFFYFYGI